MRHWTRGSVRVWALVVAFLTARALGGLDAPLLKIGDVLPRVAGQTPTGKPLDLPTAAEGKLAIVIFSFSRAGGRDAQNWAQLISKDDPHLPLYTAIFLESVPHLFRSFAVSGIRSGMPAEMQARTLLLYQQQSIWKQRLQIADENHASVLVLGPGGRVQWMSSGPLSESLYLRLRREISH